MNCPINSSCVIHFIEAPAIAHGRVRGYDHHVPNRILPGEFYAEAAYSCDPGFGFEAANAPRAMYCSEGEWVGRRPKCVKEETVVKANAGMQFDRK